MRTSYQQFQCQTCGLNHGNDRLDTVCLPCFPDFDCLGAKNAPIKCKVCNTSANPAFTDHYDAARGGLGCGEASVEVCTQCPSLSSLSILVFELVVAYVPLQYEPGSADLYVFGSPKNTEGYQFSKTFFGVIFENNPKLRGKPLRGDWCPP